MNEHSIYAPAILKPVYNESKEYVDVVKASKIEYMREAALHSTAPNLLKLGQQLVRIGRLIVPASANLHRNIFGVQLPSHGLHLPATTSVGRIEMTIILLTYQKNSTTE